MMKWRRHVTASVTLAFCAAAVSPVLAQQIDGPNVHWRFSVWGKPRAVTVGIEHLSKRLAEKTGGKFKLQIGYETFSKDRENLDSIKIGAIDGAQFCNFYHPGKNPAFMVFSLPFMPLGDWDVSRKARAELYRHPALIADMDRWDAVIYTSTYLPQYEFMGRGAAPETLDGWKGKRVRAGGGIGDAMEKLGAIKTTTTATEVYTSMQRGSMDAASFPHTYSHAAYKLHEISEWYTTNMSPGTADCPLAFSKTSLAKLPEQYRKLLDDLKEEVDDLQIKAYVDVDKVNIPIFNARLKPITYTDEQLDEFRKVAGKPVWDAWVAANKDKFDGQELIDTIFRIAAEHKK